MNHILDLNEGVGKEELKDLLELASKLGINKILLRNIFLSKEDYHSIRLNYNDKIDILAIPNDKVYESAVLTKDVQKGEVITQDYITFRKQLKGITKDKIDLIIGKRALYDLKKDGSITFGVIDL